MLLRIVGTRQKWKNRTSGFVQLLFLFPALYPMANLQPTVHHSSDSNRAKNSLMIVTTTQIFEKTPSFIDTTTKKNVGVGVLL